MCRPICGTPYHVLIVISHPNAQAVEQVPYHPTTLRFLATDGRKQRQKLVHLGHSPFGCKQEEAGIGWG